METFFNYPVYSAHTIVLPKPITDSSGNQITTLNNNQTDPDPGYGFNIRADAENNGNTKFEVYRFDPLNGQLLPDKKGSLDPAESYFGPRANNSKAYLIVVPSLPPPFNNNKLWVEVELIP